MDTDADGFPTNEIRKVALGFGTKKNKGTVILDMADGSVTISDITLTTKDWRRLRLRIDRTLERKGFGDPAVRRVATPAGTTFILKNIVALNKVQRGYVKPAPKWLKHRYDWIITKEELHG